jgi:hypothetical protein
MCACVYRSKESGGFFKETFENKHVVQSCISCCKKIKLKINVLFPYILKRKLREFCFILMKYILQKSSYIKKLIPSGKFYELFI